MFVIIHFLRFLDTVCPKYRFLTNRHTFKTFRPEMARSHKNRCNSTIFRLPLKFHRMVKLKPKKVCEKSGAYCRRFWLVTSGSGNARLSLRTTEKSYYERPGGRCHAFARLISQQPHVRLMNGFLSWVATFFLSCVEPVSIDMGVECSA